MNLEFPEEIVEALGPEPERAALEAVLLFLIYEDKISVARGGGRGIGSWGRCLLS